jgi:hypothetical protein
MPIRYPGGVGTPFPDNSPVVLDSDDGTKGLRIDTGSLATGTIAVLTVTASGSFPGAGGTAIDVEGTAVAGPISSLAAAGALTGAELVPVVQTGNTVQTTAQDIANLANPPQFIRTGVQWVDTSNNTFSTGTIDVSIAPYNGGANVSNGDAILNAYRVAQTGPNTGIWEVTNVNVGLNQATVVRRADAAIGKPFYAGEFIYDFGSYSTYELEEIFNGISDVASALVDNVNNIFYWTSTPDNILNLPATGALSGTELVPVMSGAPGVTTQTTTQDIANLGGGGGVPAKLPMRSGRFYGSGSADATSVYSAAFLLEASPIFVPNAINANSLNIWLERLSDGVTTIRLALYADNNGYPGALVVESADINVGATGALGVKSTVIAEALTPGWYWLAFGCTANAISAIFAGFDQITPAATYSVLNGFWTQYQDCAGFATMNDAQQGNAMDTTGVQVNVGIALATMPNPFTAGGGSVFFSPLVILGVA